MDLVRWACYSTAYYGFALFNWSLYLAISIYSGSFFKKDTEQDKLQYSIGMQPGNKQVHGLTILQHATASGTYLRVLSPAFGITSTPCEMVSSCITSLTRKMEEVAAADLAASSYSYMAFRIVV